MRDDHKRFLVKITLFCVPFAVVLGAVAVVLALSGELTSVARALELQKESSDILVGLAYTDPTEHFKLQGLLKRRPTVLALGTSRVMQFREECFRPGVVFYNGGNSVTRLRHYNVFLSKIPAGSEPAVILLGLDQYFFNMNFDRLADDDIENRLEHDRPVFGMFTSRWLDVYRDYWSGKFTLSNLTDSTRRKHVGLNAISALNGFRRDGSYYWGGLISDPSNLRYNLDPDFSNTFDRIRKGDRRFEYGREVSTGALKEVGRFLVMAKARGIHVVGFLPPFAHRVYEHMLSMGDRYQYLRQLPDTLGEVFTQHGFPLFDFGDLARLGASDEETVDGFHGSEKAYHRAVILMAEKDPELRSYVENLDYLRDRLERPEGHHLVFDKFSGASAITYSATIH